MNIQSELVLSYYKEIAILNEPHKVVLVQNTESGQIFVKKTLDIYNCNVYSFLKDNPIMGIPKIHELISSGDKLIVIEDFISGQNLERILESAGPMPKDKVIKYTIKLCNIVVSLHQINPSIIHRDIKPTNVIITPMDEVVLIDLNAAKYVNDKVEDTMLIGTRGYAAPEQYGFGSSDIQTDIYAIGILMNTMLCGKYSVDRPTGEIGNIIRKCTELTPDNRYKNINELLNALDYLKNSPNGKKWKRFLPPGFRSGNPVYITISVFYYIFVTLICKDMKFTNSTDFEAAFKKVGTYLILLVIPFLSCNYLNIHERLPLCRSHNTIVKFIGVILFDVLISLSIMFITILLMSMFKG